ncbi:MAG: cohesin domain-containing protein [bacterium]
MLLSVDLMTGAEENVAALQFDVSYDAAQLTFNEVTAGQVTLDAGKDITPSTPSTGTIRTIVYGLNQNSIADGTIAIISFDINASASAGEVALSISNAVASDPDADSISLSTVDESITISSGGADDDSEESSEDEDIDEMMEALNGCFIHTIEN